MEESVPQSLKLEAPREHDSSLETGVGCVTWKFVSVHPSTESIRLCERKACSVNKRLA